MAQVTDVLPVVGGGAAGAEPTVPPKRQVTAPPVVALSQGHSVAMSRSVAPAPRRNLFLVALLVFDAALAISGSVLWHKSRQRVVRAPGAQAGSPAQATVPVDGNPATATPSEPATRNRPGANGATAATGRPSNAPSLPVGSAASATVPTGNNNNGNTGSAAVGGSTTDVASAGSTRPAPVAPGSGAVGSTAGPGPGSAGPGKPSSGSATPPSASGGPQEGDVNGSRNSTNPMPQPQPQPQAGAADSDPFLDAELVQAVLADDIARQTTRSNAAFDRCYRAATKALPPEQPLQGNVTIAFTVQPTGAVSGVGVSANSTESDQLASCVVREVSKWRFAAFTGEAAQFMRTIRFDGR